MLVPVDGDPRVWDALLRGWNEFVYDTNLAARSLQSQRELWEIRRRGAAQEDEEEK